MKGLMTNAHLVLLKSDLHTHFATDDLIFKRPEPIRFKKMPIRSCTGSEEGGHCRGRKRALRERKDLLIPIVNGVVVDQDRLYLDGAQETLVRDSSVVDVESD